MSNNKQSSVEKEFVPYAEALALKEFGFDEPCYKYIYIGDTGINVDYYLEVEPSKSRNYNEDSLCISQPTFQQSFRWFREKYQIDSWIYPNLSGLYSVSIVWRGVGLGKVSEYQTYLEAELACLKKLIEIVKEKNK